MGPTWDPPGFCRPQMGPMMAPWTLLSGMAYALRRKAWNGTRSVAALCLPYRFSTWPLGWITDSPSHPWLIATVNDDWWIWFIACFCLVGFCLGQTGSERNCNTVKLTRKTHVVLLFRFVMVIHINLMMSCKLFSCICLVCFTGIKTLILSAK